MWPPKQDSKQLVELHKNSFGKPNKQSHHNNSLMMIKISTTAFLLLVSLVESRPNTENNGLLKYGSQSQGHKITLCVDGADVCNRSMEMKLSRLLEVDNNGTDVGNAAKNFNNPNFVNYNWSTPERILDEQNVSIGTRVRLDTDLLIGKPKDENYASFSLITELFSNDTTVIYANETIEVAKNAMKFSILCSEWPFVSDLNSLAFGIKLRVKTRSGKDVPDSPRRRQRNSSNESTSIVIETLDLGDGMFLDSPLVAIIDDEFAGNVTTTIEAATDDSGISIDWILPHFNVSLFYDPIMAEGPEEQPETGNDDDSDDEDKLDDIINNPVVGDEDRSSDDEINSSSSFSFLLPVLITLIYSSNLII
jgi:hypothetical protein